MTMDYIRTYYHVPAEVGTRVIADGAPGTICGAKDQYLLIQLDGHAEPDIWHPTWHIIYP
jgi:hypothetical protein